MQGLLFHRVLRNAIKLRPATKNVRELIAESFAYHVIGKKLPKDVVKLVERSIAYAKNRIEKEKE